MKGLIQKSGYIKPGNGGGHYAEYIATREGVELMDAQYPFHEGSGYLEYMAERSDIAEVQERHAEQDYFQDRKPAIQFIVLHCGRKQFHHFDLPFSDCYSNSST